MVERDIIVTGDDTIGVVCSHMLVLYRRDTIG